MAIYLDAKDVRGILLTAKEKSERAMQSMNYEISTPTLFAPKQDRLYSTIINGLLEGKKTVHHAIKQSYTSADGLLQNVVYLDSRKHRTEPKLLKDKETKMVVETLFRKTSGKGNAAIYREFVRPVLLDRESSDDGGKDKPIPATSTLPGEMRNVFLYLTQITMAVVRDRNARKNHLPSTLFVLFQKEAMNLPDDMSTVNDAINAEAERRKKYSNPRHVSDYQRVICLMPATFTIQLKIAKDDWIDISVHTLSFVVWSWKFGSADIPSVTIYYAIMESNADLIDSKYIKRIHTHVRWNLMATVIRAFLGLEIVPAKETEKEEFLAKIPSSPIKPIPTQQTEDVVRPSKDNASLMQALFGVPNNVSGDGDDDGGNVPPVDGVLKPIYTLSGGINVVNCSNEAGDGGPFDLFSLFFMLESFPMHYGPTSITRFRYTLLKPHISSMLSPSMDEEKRYTSAVDHFRSQIFSAATSVDGPLLDLTEAESFRNMHPWMRSFVYGKRDTITGVAAMQGIEVTTKKKKTTEEIVRDVERRKRRETLEMKDYPLPPAETTAERSSLLKVDPENGKQAVPETPIAPEKLAEESMEIAEIAEISGEVESEEASELIEMPREEQRERMINAFWENFHLLKTYLMRKGLSTHKRLSFLAVLLDAISSIHKGPKETWRALQGDENIAKAPGYHWMKPSKRGRSVSLRDALKNKDYRRGDVNAWSLFYASEHFHSPERVKTYGDDKEEAARMLDIRRIGPSAIQPFMEYLEEHVRDYYFVRLNSLEQTRMVSSALEVITKAFSGRNDELKNVRDKIMAAKDPIFGKDMYEHGRPIDGDDDDEDPSESSVASFFDGEGETGTTTGTPSTEEVNIGTLADEDKRKWISNRFLPTIRYRFGSGELPLSSYGRLETLRQLVWALLPTTIDDTTNVNHGLVLELNDLLDPKESEVKSDESMERELTEPGLQDRLKENPPTHVTLRMLKDRKPFVTVAKSVVLRYLEWLIGTPDDPEDGHIYRYINELTGVPLDEIFKQLQVITNDPAYYPTKRKGWIETKEEQQARREAMEKKLSSQAMGLVERVQRAKERKKRDWVI